MTWHGMAWHGLCENGLFQIVQSLLYSTVCRFFSDRQLYELEMVTQNGSELSE